MEPSVLRVHKSSSLEIENYFNMLEKVNQNYINIDDSSLKINNDSVNQFKIEKMKVEIVDYQKVNKNLQ